MRPTTPFIAVLASTLLLVGVCQAQVEDLSNKALLQAAQESGKIIAENKPTSERMLEPSTYFLDAFNKPRKVGTKTFTMAGTDNKLVVCNAVANAMLKLTQEKGDEVPATLLTEWIKQEDKVLAFLAAENSQKETAMSENEVAVWKQFFEEWRNDVIRTDSARFKDALLQAAYEVTKAGLEIQTAQEAEARTGQATPTSTTRGSYLSPSGSPFHERRMNHIYHHHERRLMRAQMIRSRR